MKKTIGLWIALVALFVPTVANAATDKLPDAENNVITLTEDVTLAAGFVVSEDQNITLDLAGHTLTTSTGLKADTIYVEKGASLKIIGNGTIEVSTKGYATVFNNGTVVIDGATLKRDTTGGNDWYVLLNHGTMTIEKANVSVNGTGSSLVENGYYNYSKSTDERLGYVEGTNEASPKLIINGGVFDGGMNTIKNDDNGVLEVNEGTFQNNYQVSIMNWNVTTINGGTFKTPAGNDKTNLFVGTAGADSVNKGILVINDGTFEAEHLLEGYTGVITPVEINGGTFEITDSFFNEEPDKSPENFVESGAEIVGNVTAPKVALAYAKKGATVNLTDAKLGDKLTAEEGVYIALPESAVGNLAFTQNEDGSLTIVESADLTKLAEILNKIMELNEEDYTEESAAILTKVIEDNAEAIVNPNFTKEEQDKVDALTKKLEDAVAALVKISDADSKPSVPTEPEIENPKTGDNILLYVITGIVSVCGLAYFVKSKRFN